MSTDVQRMTPPSSNGHGHAPHNTAERSRQAMIAPLERLLLPAGDASATSGVSLRTWARLDASGRIPAAIRLGGRKLWRAAELADWTAAGCPPRAEWRWDSNGNGPPT